MNLRKKARELGLELPAPFPPAGDYVPVRLIAGWAHVSGQGPLLPDGKFITGKVGGDVSLERAQEAAGWSALSALAVLEEELGDLDRILGVARVVGYINAAPGFNATPAVLNGCSQMLIRVLGEVAGVHARSAVGVSELPFDIAVEVDVTVAVDGRQGV
jgi:enamine deaminase RidA (YjgF/YER057c/UK114 family)